VGFFNKKNLRNSDQLIKENVSVVEPE